MARPATAEQIEAVLRARLSDGSAWKSNWGTALDNSIWEVGDGTYINGIVASVDFDFEGMYLLEIVNVDKKDRNGPSEVRWLAVSYPRRFKWYPFSAKDFFDRRDIKQWDVIDWAMKWYRQIDERSRVDG